MTPYEWRTTEHRGGGYPVATAHLEALGFGMLGWALTFLVIAIIAAIFGFGGIAGTAAGIAQILFYIFLAIFIVSLLFGLVRRGP